MKVMLDLETMGTGSNSTIIAIGAVFFSDSATLGSFYANVSKESCEDEGMVSDAATVKWWSEQSEEAKAALKGNQLDIIDALNEFKNWLNRSDTPIDNIEIWGNGSMFDNTILSNAYLSCGMEIPWKFYNDRCYRTVKNVYPEIKLNRVGVHHNAVDDAKSQALHLIEILKSIPSVGQ